jgi:hypothetical protein
MTKDERKVLLSLAEFLESNVLMSSWGVVATKKEACDLLRRVIYAVPIEEDDDGRC